MLEYRLLWLRYRLFAERESRVEGYPVSAGHIILAFPRTSRLFPRVVPRVVSRDSLASAMTDKRGRERVLEARRTRRSDRARNRAVGAADSGIGHYSIAT